MDRITRDARILTSSLHCLIAKLAHPKEAVRTAALESLQLMVSERRLNLADSPENTDLLLRSLLEWFNFPEYSHGDVVLGILIRLAQEPFTHNCLLELGTMEFMQQFRIYGSPSLWPAIDRLVYLLESPCNSDIDDLLEVAATKEGFSPEAPTPKMSQASLMTCSEKVASSPNSCEMCSPMGHFDAEIDLDDSLNIPCFNLELHEKTYLYDLSVRLKCFGDRQGVETALKELRDVVVDFHPEIILQELKFPEILVALVQELNDNRLEAIAFEILRLLVNQVKVTLSVYNEPVFQAHPDDCKESDDTERCDFVSYPVPSFSSGQHPNADGCSPTGCVLPLGRVLHVIVLQLLSLLTDVKKHIPALKILRLILPLLPPATPLKSQVAMQFMHYFRAIDSVLNVFRERGQLADSLCSKETAIQHCSPVLNVLFFTADLMSLFQPADIAGLLTKELTTSLTIVTGDAILAECTVGLHEKLLPYLSYLDASFVRSYYHSNVAFSFLHEFETVLASAKTVFKGSEEMQVKVLFEKMLCILPYIGYTSKIYQVTDYFKTILELLRVELSRVEDVTGADMLLSLASDLLLCLVSNSFEDVMHMAYEALIEACQIEQLLRREKNNDGKGSTSFVLHLRILSSKPFLTEILTCGLQSRTTCKQAAKVLLSLVDFFPKKQTEIKKALPWISSLSNIPEMAEQVICALLKESFEDFNVVHYLVTTSSPEDRWSVLCHLLMQLFSKDDWERYQAGKKLLEVLQSYYSDRKDTLWFNYYQLTDEASSTVPKDPFHHTLSYGDDEFAECPELLDLKCSEPPESLFFKTKSMRDLMSLFRDKSADADVQRSATEQLIRLLEDSPSLPPVDGVEKLIEDLIEEIIRWIQAKPISGDDLHGHTCLTLVTRLAVIPCLDGAVKFHQVLLSDPSKFVEPLLPLVFHPSAAVRHEIAILLSYMLFSLDVLGSSLDDIKLLDASFSSSSDSHSKTEIYFWENAATSKEIPFRIFIPINFFECYQFPCPAVPVKICNFQQSFQFSQDESLVMCRVSQLKILEGGPELAIQTLKKRSKEQELSAVETQGFTSLTALCPRIIIANVFKRLNCSKTVDEDIYALNDLDRLFSYGPKAGEILAKEAWMNSFQRFLAGPAKTSNDITLLLKVLKVVDCMLLNTGNLTSEGLVYLASNLRTGVIPLLAEYISIGETGSADADEVEYRLLYFLVSILKDARDREASNLFLRVSSLLAKGTDLLPTLRFRFAANRIKPYVSCVLAVQCVCHITACVSDSHFIDRNDDQNGDTDCGNGWLTGGLVETIIPFIKYLARFCSKERFSLRHKQLVREILYCLWCISASVDSFLWQGLWVSVGPTFWLCRLTNDKEAKVRGIAFALIALLASDSTPITRDWLRKSWPEFEEVVVRTALKRSECYAVRQECLRFILGNSSTLFSWCSSETSSQDDFALVDYSGLSAALERHGFWEELPHMLTEGNACFGFRVVVLDLILMAATLSQGSLKHNYFCTSPKFFGALMQCMDSSDLNNIQHCAVVSQATKLLALLAYHADSEVKTLIYSSATTTKLIHTFCSFAKSKRENVSKEHGSSCVTVTPLSVHAANAIFYSSTALNVILFELNRKDKDEEVEANTDVVGGQLSLDKMVMSSGLGLCRSALSILESLPRLESAVPLTSNPDNMPSWKIRMAVCALICTLLAEEKVTVFLFEKESGNEVEDLTTQLCASLIVEFEDTYAISCSPFQGNLVIPALLAVGTALQNLLAYSSKAKHSVLKLSAPKRFIDIAYEVRSKLFEKSVTSFPRDQNLNLISYDLSSAHSNNLELHSAAFPDPGQGKRPDIAYSEVKGYKLLLQKVLLLSFRLLKNLVYNSPEAAEACVEFRVLELVRSLWRYTMADDDMLHEVLGILCNLAAQSDNAKDIIATEECPSGKADLMNQVCGLIGQPSLDKVSYLLAIGMLQSLMTKTETRAAFLRKKHLPLILGQLGIATRAKDCGRQHILLQLLVNVTAHPYGQHMVLESLSSKDEFNLILDIVEKGKYPAKTALFLLRNLAFSRESRPLFFVNQRTIPLLVNSVTSQSIEAQAYAASAIWVLLSNGHKIAKILKRIGSLPVLVSAQANVKSKLEELASTTTITLTSKENHLLLHAYQLLSAINQLAGAFQKPILNYNYNIQSTQSKKE